MIALYGHEHTLLIPTATDVGMSAQGLVHFFLRVSYPQCWSVESKTVPLHAMKALVGRGVQLLLILDLGTRRG
jgi:hypothetical protein